MKTKIFLLCLLLSLAICGCDLPAVSGPSGSHPAENPTGSATQGTGGARVETTVLEDGTVCEKTYNEAGILVQEVFTRDAGEWDASAVPAVKEVFQYKAQGIVEKSDITYANGDRHLVTHHENGNWAILEIIFPNGTSRVFTYDTEGNVVDSVDKDAAGNVVTTPEDNAVYTYHPNGKVASKVYTLEDGTVTEEYYDESGHRTKSVDQYTSGEKAEHYYDENRVLIRYVYHQPDGFFSDETYQYYEDGSVKTVIFSDSDGGSGEMTFFPGRNDAVSHSLNIFANGDRYETFYIEKDVPSKRIDTINGVTEETVYTYYDNGQKASESTTGSDGGYRVTTYYENGTKATYEAKSISETGETFWKEQYSAGGILLLEIYQDPNQYSEDIYNETGARQRKIYRTADGTENVTTYSNGGTECITTYPDGSRWIYATDANGKVIKDGPL